MRLRWIPAALLSLALTACGGGPEARSPRDAVVSCADALEQGDYAAAWGYLDLETRSRLGKEEFVSALSAHPEQARDLAARLRAATGEAQVSATISLTDGSSLELLFEDGRFRLDGRSLDPWPQDTPERALRSFVEAFSAHRYDVLLRFVPRAKAEGIDEERLRAAFEGEEREEFEGIVAALRAALGTARPEVLGERATMSYGNGSRVLLVFEEERWKIEDFK